MPQTVENKPTRVSVGSTADVPEDLARKLNILVIPAEVTIGKTTLIDNPDVSFKDFYNLMDKEHQFPTTSAPGPEVFKNIWAQYDGPVLPVTAANKLSGYYDFATLARNDLRQLPDNETTKRLDIYEPWNSLSVSLGEGFPAIIAAEMLAKGIPIGEVLQKLDETRRRIYVFAVAGSTKYYEKSGRITGVEAFMGSLLQIKPCVTAYDNEIVPFAKYRTYSAATTALAEFAAQHAPIERMAVLHTGNEEISQQMIDAVQRIGVFDPQEIIRGPVTKVIAAHNGPDSFGLMFVGVSR